MGRLGTALDLIPATNLAEGILGVGKTLAKITLADSDAEAFRESVTANAGAVIEFLLMVRSQTSDMFNDALLVEPAPRKNDLEKFKQSLAVWVLLIDETIITLNALEHVIQKGGATGTKLAVLAASTDRLAGYAEDMRFALRQIEDSF